MPTENPVHHTCPDCFYSWEHGRDGSHNCVQRLKARISVLSAALQENHEWHQQYDEYGGYPDSALEATNTNALIGATAEWKLPCQVRLPGGMTIGKGCNLNTLSEAFAAAPAQPAAHKAPTPETVWMRLLDVMRSDNGCHFYASTADFAEARDAIAGLVRSGFFIEWRNDLEDDYWMAAAGEQSEASARFSSEAYETLSAVLNRVFERTEEPAEPAAQDQGEVQRLQIALRLSANRFDRLALEFPDASDMRWTASEWANEARSAIAASTGQEVTP